MTSGVTAVLAELSTFSVSSAVPAASASATALVRGPSPSVRVRKFSV